MRVEIIAVGSELLTPDRLDTNSLFITERLNEIGIEVQAKSVVGDEPNRLRAVFVHALERADLVLLTGGLGPTDDDLTRDVVAEVLKLALE
jgi:nicotinamide-nucleotide amidase